MRVVVDRDLCQGHAMCVAEAPSVFAIGKHDDQVTVLEPTLSADVMADVRRAVTYCPTGALSLAED